MTIIVAYVPRPEGQAALDKGIEIATRRNERLVVVNAGPGGSQSQEDSSVMNGYEAARAIRASQHPDAQRIPILAMTANAFAEDISAALAAGMNRHIAKPIDVKVLFRTLREVFLTEKKTDFPDSKM